jgi:hypothetical protein
MYTYHILQPGGPWFEPFSSPVKRNARGRTAFLTCVALLSAGTKQDTTACVVQTVPRRDLWRVRSEEAHHILERVSVVTVHTGTNFGEHLAVGVCTGGR